MQIRNARVEDREALTDLHFYMWNVFYSDFLPQAYSAAAYSRPQCEAIQAKMLSDCADSPASHQAWVVEEAGRVAGLCYLSRHLPSGDVLDMPDCAAELNRLYIWPEYRGTGLGARLLGLTFDWVRARRMGSLFAWSFDLNPYSRFYPKHGAGTFKKMPYDYSGTWLGLTAYGWQFDG